jgi:hypothetical protein
VRPALVRSVLTPGGRGGQNTDNHGPPPGPLLLALGGEALLPSALTNRARGLMTALISSFALVTLIFMSPAWIVPLLALTAAAPLRDAAPRETGPSGAFG